MKRLALLLLLASLSFPSLIWQASTDGPVAAKPLAFQGILAVPSEDGNVYALDPSAGSKVWQARVGLRPNEVISFDNGIVASTTSGTVTKLDRSGKKLWVVDLNGTGFNASYVFGASANAKEVFVSADNGIYSIGKNGSVRSIVSFDPSLVTAPAAGADYVVYGIGGRLYKVGDNGIVAWSADIAGGSFLPAPGIVNDVIFVGALDGMMHAYSVNGGQIWQARTRNWVMGTPLVSGGVVYFGSNDGGVYAVDATTGTVLWDAQTQLAVQSQPEAGTMGGRSVIFAGSSDKSIYAIDASNGEIVWKGSANGGVGSPLFYQDTVIFGSDDWKVYAYSTERACSITSPVEAKVLGLKEVVVTGRFVSSAGGATVLVDVNGQGWQQANTSEDGWVYYVNPAASFNPGLNVISCKVVDNGGEETGQTFTSVAVNFDPGIPPSQLVVTATPNVLENVPFTVFVNDGDDGSPVERFNLTVDGRAQNGNDNVTLQLPAGTHNVVVKKIGFNDAYVSINVSSSGLNPLYVVVGVVLILIIVWRAWSSLRASRPRSR